MGEEGPQWCLPARFNSSPSISMRATHRLPPLLLAISSLLLPLSPPSLLSYPPIKYLSNTSVCVWMFQESSWLCRQWEGRKEEKEGKELKELEPWLQSSMTQSGCIHAPGENTQNMYQNTQLSPLCNQCVQMLTFPL